MKLGTFSEMKPFQQGDSPRFIKDAAQSPQERVQQSQAKTRDRPSRVVRWILKKTSKVGR